MRPIYLDYNATTPIHPEVADAMEPYLREHFGNPSSSHWYGKQTRKAVEKAREQVAAMLGCAVDEVTFTSGGSEANNLALIGYALANQERGNHLITSAVEHPAVLEVCRFLETHGLEVDYLPVDEHGRVDPGKVEHALRQSTLLVSIMQANNEVGTLQPIREISDLAHDAGAVLHTDSAQAVGKVPVTAEATGADMISVAAHKFYAPKGVGALYVRRGIRLQKLIHGADHELNLRAGTENVLEIAGLGKACELVSGNLDEWRRHCADLADRLEGILRKELHDARVNGHPDERLPNTLSISFPGISAQEIMARAGNVACSAGAACHSEGVSISHVLSAMKVPAEIAMGTLRLSTGLFSSEEDVDRAAGALVAAIRGLKG